MTVSGFSMQCKHLTFEYHIFWRLGFSCISNVMVISRNLSHYQLLYSSMSASAEDRTVFDRILSCNERYPLKSHYNKTFTCEDTTCYKMPIYKKMLNCLHLFILLNIIIPYRLKNLAIKSQITCLNLPEGAFT